MKRWLAIVLIVVVALVVGAAGVFGGRAMAGTPSPQEAAKVLSSLTTQQRQQLAQSGGLSGAFGGSRGTAGGGSGSGGFTSGSIVSSESNSVTIQLSDGSTKIVLYAPSTAISVSQTGSASDLTAGQSVTVTGTANSDGSITATRIQVGSAVSRPTGGTTGTTAGGGQSATGSTVTTAGTGTSAQ